VGPPVREKEKRRKGITEKKKKQCLAELVYDPTWALLCQKKRRNHRKKGKRGITELVYDPAWALL
jgi:hypothetical protein